MSRSSSLRFSLSSEMVASVWVTRLSSCETVTRPWTSEERRVVTGDSDVIVPASVSGLKPWRSGVLRRRTLLA